MFHPAVLARVLMKYVDSPAQLAQTLASLHLNARVRSVASVTIVIDDLSAIIAEHGPDHRVDPDLLSRARLSLLAIAADLVDSLKSSCITVKLLVTDVPWSGAAVAYFGALLPVLITMEPPRHSTAGAVHISSKSGKASLSSLLDPDHHAIVLHQL